MFWIGDEIQIGILVIEIWLYVWSRKAGKCLLWFSKLGFSKFWPGLRCTGLNCRSTSHVWSWELNYHCYGFKIRVCGPLGFTKTRGKPYHYFPCLSCEILSPKVEGIFRNLQLFLIISTCKLVQQDVGLNIYAHLSMFGNLKMSNINRISRTRRITNCSSCSKYIWVYAILCSLISLSCNLFSGYLKACVLQNSYFDLNSCTMVRSTSVTGNSCFFLKFQSSKYVYIFA